MRRALPERPILAAAMAVVVLLAIPATTLAAPTWQVTQTPASVNAGEVTEIQMTITLQSVLLVDLIGCVTVGIDPTFSISAPRIISTPIAKSWLNVAPMTPGPVTFAALAGNDRLAGNVLSYESVTVGVTVDGAVGGTYTWAVAAYANKNCSSKLSEKTITISVLGGNPPTPTPAPTAPTPTPFSTPTPTLAPTPTPQPGTSAFPTPSGSTSPSPSSSPDAPSPQPTGSVDPGATLIPATVIDPPSASGRPGLVPGALAFQVPTSANGTVDVAGVQLAAAVIGSLGIFRWAVPGALLSIPGLLIVLLTILAQAGGGLLWMPIVRRKLGSKEPTAGSRAKDRA